MSKKVKVLVSVLIAVALLIVGSAATVMAQEEPTQEESAQQELKGEAFIKYVEKAAEKGIITQEEAEAIIKWWESRPEALDRLFPYPHIVPSIRSRHMWGDGDNGATG